MFTLADAKKVAAHFRINLEVVPLQILKYALNVELEHGLKAGAYNVTSDSLYKTARIAIAHLMEFPDYYVRLRKLEKQAEKYWKGKVKPNIFA